MEPRRPQLESLRVFEAAARHGNFSRAASELGVTPAAVSLRVRMLEDELGRKLFDRHGPRVTLTDSGSALASGIGQALTLAHAAVAACRTSQAPLRVTVTPTLAARWLAPRLPRYRALPGAGPIRLEVSTDLRKRGEFDIAIRSGSGDWPGLRRDYLLPVERTPMLAPGLAKSRAIVTPRDLEALPLLRDENWSAWFREAGIANPRLSFAPVEYTTQEMAAGGALEGAGAVLLSPLLFAPLVAEGRLLRPFPQVLRTGEAYFALCAEEDRRAPVDHFIAWLRAEAGRS